MDGHGILKYRDGSIYEGLFSNGKKHGKGTFVDINGNIFEGNWRDGKRNGKGKLKKGGRDNLSWEWKNDRPVERLGGN